MFIDWPRSISPNRRPRGIDWMPSSPWVKGAWKAEEIEHLRQGQRDHGEVDALPADGDGPMTRPRRAAPRTPSGCRPRATSPRPDRVAGEVGGAAEEGGMAKGEQPRIAQKQVEGRGEQRECQKLHQEDRVQGTSARPAAPPAREGPGPAATAGAGWTATCSAATVSRISGHVRHPFPKACGPQDQERSP